VSNPAVGRGNLLIVALMAAFWITPMVQFWAAVFGPLRPFSYPDGDLAPPLHWMVAGVAFCFLPCLLPRAYYRVAPAHRARRLYEALGVRIFKAFATDGDRINRRARRVDPRYRVIRDRSAVDCFEAGTMAGERSHLVLLLVGLCSGVFALRIGWHGWAAGLTAANVIFNLYPVLLQRYNRARIARLRGRWGQPAA